MISNFIWVAAGNMLMSILAKKWVAKYQGIFFGIILIVTAMWLGIG